MPPRPEAERPQLLKTRLLGPTRVATPSPSRAVPLRGDSPNRRPPCLEMLRLTKVDTDLRARPRSAVRAIVGPPVTQAALGAPAVAFLTAPASLLVSEPRRPAAPMGHQLVAA